MNFRLKWALGVALLAGTAVGSGAQSMPASIAGSWRITRIVTSGRTACWDEARARTLLGSTLTYTQGTMSWMGGNVPVPEVLTRTLSRRKYQDEYKVDLAELGIRADSIVEIDLQHEDADVTGATTEVPGDTVLLNSTGRGGHPELLLSACGVYYAAVRAGRR